MTKEELPNELKELDLAEDEIAKINELVQKYKKKKLAQKSRTVVKISRPKPKYVMGMDVVIINPSVTTKLPPQLIMYSLKKGRIESVNIEKEEVWYYVYIEAFKKVVRFREKMLLPFDEKLLERKDYKGREISKVSRYRRSY